MTAKLTPQLWLQARPAGRLPSMIAVPDSVQQHETAPLRPELFGTGVRVNAIDPGLAETEFSIVRFKGDIEFRDPVFDD
jgi:NADP-dependent 3-hydroxy acid dehydrogenase YdfG